MAIAELIDNGIQAGATEINVDVLPSGDKSCPIEIEVTDNGKGMGESEISECLSFGGSTRFNNRDSLGRFGMGLPNGGLSRARRIEVVSWRDEQAMAVILDIDELTETQANSLSPALRLSSRRPVPSSRSGTKVTLKKCDRIEYRRAATLSSVLTRDFGRIYRHRLTQGLVLKVDGVAINPSDPLMLLPDPRHGVASPFGDVLCYELRAGDLEGLVEVRFSELPVAEWHSLSSDEKRCLGVTGSSTVSVVRGGRELDRGWFFMGSKRRENYDDWWRCEVSFDPSLDEFFGITHSKQSINPTAELDEMLSRDLEPIARALNIRVRRSFELVKLRVPINDAEIQASVAARSLVPLPNHFESSFEQFREICRIDESVVDPRVTHRVIISDSIGTAAFEVGVTHGQVAVLLNAKHPLYRELYGPLATSDRENDRLLANRLTLFLLAMGRAEVGLTKPNVRKGVAEMRQSWSDILSTFLNA